MLIWLIEFSPSNLVCATLRCIMQYNNDRPMKYKPHRSIDFLFLFFDGTIDLGEALIQNAPILDHAKIFKAEGTGPRGKPLRKPEWL